MFDFFRKKRIEKHVEAASEYAERVRIAYLRKQGVKFKFPVISHEEDDKSKTHSGGDIQYSLRNPGDIPNHGDRFHASSVRTLMDKKHSDFGAERLAKDLDQLLDLSFVDMVIRYINEKGWRDSRVYKAAQMDRRLFSKIMSDRHYKPSKDTAIALVIALELSLKQAEDLLSRAGYTLSHSSKRDVIIEYFVREGIYNLSDINEVLYRLDQKILGR